MAESNGEAEAAAPDTAADQTTAETVEAPAEATKTEAAVETGKPEKTTEKAPAETTQADWRASIQDQKLRDHAGRFVSASDLAKAHLDLRAQLSKAIVPPAKDASPEEIAAYEKKLGVPDQYDFPVPEGYQLTDHDKAFRKEVSELFRANRVTGDAGKAIAKWFEGKQAEAMAAQQKAAETAAVQMETELRKEWGQDFDTNAQIAAQAWQKFGGTEDLENLKLDGGSRLGDHPAMLRIMARIGRATMETAGMLGMSESAASDLQTQHDEAVRKSQEALDRGDRDEAMRWTNKGDAIARRLWGTAPAPGYGRAA